MQEDTFHLGVKALITNSDKVLLLQVNKKQLSGETREYWDLPGGRIQQGQTIEETLRRELEEETGIKDVRNTKLLGMCLSNIRIPMGDGEDVGLVLAVFACEIDLEVEITLTSEHIGYNWFTKEEAAELLSVKYPQDFVQLILKA